MGDHYVPQHYLRGFSDPPLFSKIWVYEKGSTQKFQSSIKSVANEKQRWPPHVEKYLANKIEAPANFVLDKIRSRQLISQSDKDVLSAYMVVMMQRVDRGLERMKEIAPEIIEQIFTTLEKQIQTDIEKNPSRRDALTKVLHELPILKLKYTAEFPIEIWYQNLTPDGLPQIRAILPQMTWVFFTADKKQPFLTNDNPIVFFEWEGVGKPNSEIVFPISSEIVLWATWRKNIVDNQYATAKEAIIREINRRVVHSATKYVYYSIEADWVVNLVNKKNIRLNRISH
jgi:hypothetical protein